MYITWVNETGRKFKQTQPSLKMYVGSVYIGGIYTHADKKYTGVIKLPGVAEYKMKSDEICLLQIGMSKHFTDWRDKLYTPLDYSLDTKGEIV